jgi:arylsulfatase
MFTTLASVADAKVPTDRVIDGIDQIAFFTGKQEKSNRDGFPVYVFNDLAAVKWKDWKWHLFWKPEPDPASFRDSRSQTSKKIVQKLFNLRSDPKEEYDVFWAADNQQVLKSIDAYMIAFQKTLETEPPIPPRAPDNYKPAKPGKATGKK